jgi:hypothetical protein
LIYTGRIEGMGAAPTAAADVDARRRWLSAAVLCLDALFLLSPPAIGLLVLAGVLR